MEIPYEFQDFYDKIVEPNIFIQDEWYQISGNRTERDFLEWYYKETMAIEFSGDRRHFRVVAYPVRSVVPDFLLNKGKEVPVVSDNSRPRPKLPLYVRKEGIKGYDLNEERIKKIMDKWIAEQESSTKEHEKKMDFLKKKREFFEQ